jgi:hypothetical protein
MIRAGWAHVSQVTVGNDRKNSCVRFRLLR